MKNAIRRHLELERLFGADFLPARKRSGSPARKQASPPPSAAPSRVRPAAPRPDEPPEWTAFREQVLACTKCSELCATRTQVVFGVGSTTAPVMFVGEAPGEDEDRQGEPFVGRAGQLLTRTLKKLGVSREQVYIANVLKCRPPGNRTPQPAEMLNCMPYLLRQIQTIKPRLICVMGNIAAKAILNSTRGITSLRGRYHEFHDTKVFATFHPAYVLRNMAELATFEADIRRALTDAGLIAS